MDAATLQKVRAVPLFATLSDAQLECIEPGEIIEVPAGTVLVSEGDRYPFFLVVLEGEIRIVRNYDSQEILMGVIKPGNYTGELTLLLDIPWPVDGPSGKTGPSFPARPGGFLADVEHVPFGGSGNFSLRRQQDAQPGRLLTAAGKAGLPRHDGGGSGA